MHYKLTKGDDTVGFSQKAKLAGNTMYFRPVRHREGGGHTQSKTRTEEAVLRS